MIQSKLLYYDFYIGELIFETSIHIGCSEIAADTDSPLLRDVSGRHYLPGSSIIGPMKARACEIFKGNEDLIKNVFGFQEEGKDGKSFMSRLKIEDAYPEIETAATSIRDGVAIDRSLGSASPGAKYDMEITPFDIHYPFSMRLELRKDDKFDEMRSIVEGLINEFKNGRIKLGGGKSRGLGRCTLTCECYCLDFSNNAEVAKFLLNRNPIQLPKLAIPDPIPTSPNYLQIEIDLLIKDSPFLIKHGLDDDEYDAVFTKVMSNNGGETDYIPGASIKGVLRARAEKIVRTLSGIACPVVGINSCSHSISNEIDKYKSKVNDPVFIKGKSCPICRLFGNGYLASRIVFDDTFFDASHQVQKKVFDNVAIDRFTGGAVEGKLFNSVPVVSGKINVRFSIKDPTNFDKALLLFLLRDLKEGFPPIRFGYGKTKGYGFLGCGGISINGRKLDGNDFLGLLEKPPTLENWWKGEEVNG